MIITPSGIKDYCIVCNEVARRKDLSARAKGIYYYLATLPKDWSLSQQELLRHFTEGRQSVSTAFKELVNSGYIEQSLVQNQNGLFKGYSYKVHWSCQKPVNQKTVIGKTEIGKTEIGKTDTTKYLKKLSTKEELIIKEELSTKELIKKPADESAKNELIKSSFETFWKNYGKSKEKKESLLFWKKRMNDTQRNESIYKAKIQSENIEKAFRKDPLRWLKKGCWEDEVIIKKNKGLNEAKGFDLTKKKGW